MKLSIIIPVYNEEKTIKQVLEKVLSVKLPCQKEIVVVDDGSTDGTREKLKTPRRWQVERRRSHDSCEVEESEEHIKIIHHPKNLGKGAAVRTGLKHATGDYILIQDADLEYNPDEIPVLLEPILKTPRRWPKASCEVEGSKTKPIAVYGSRFKKNQAVIPLLYLVGNKFLTLLTNFLYGAKLTDMETGYKLLPVSFIKKIKLKGNRFEIEPEITIELVRNKISIVEIPIKYHSRSRSAGKKLTLKDAFFAFKIILGKYFEL